jgi:hypothetical protein
MFPEEPDPAPVAAVDGFDCEATVNEAESVVAVVSPSPFDSVTLA